MLETMPSHRDVLYRGKEIWRSLRLGALALAAALALVAVFAAEARAGSFDPDPPEAVLMKYKTVLQTRGNAGGTWHFYDAGWNYIIYDNFGEYAFPEPAVVGAGRRPHVRFDKPERPSAVTINAWTNVKDGDIWAERPAGQRQQLQRTLRPVQQGGETVGWDAFIRVNQPDRHYYLVVRAGWDRVPGTQISYGKNVSYGLHVRTR
jgi:hypothetical protein